MVQFTSNKELSIQVTLNGFSFRILSPDSQYGARVVASGNIASYDLSSDWRIAQSEFSCAYVSWSVPETTIIPAAVFNEQLAELYLNSVGVTSVTPKNIPMYSRQGAYASVWAANSAILAAIETITPVVANTHPLLQLISAETAQRESVKVYIDAANVAHIGIWDYSSLVTAESVALASAEDLLYFVRRFSAADPFMVYRVELLGNISPRIEALFAQYYISLRVNRAAHIY